MSVTSAARASVRTIVLTDSSKGCCYLTHPAGVRATKPGAITYIRQTRGRDVTRYKRLLALSFLGRRILFRLGRIFLLLRFLRFVLGRRFAGVGRLRGRT